MSTHKVGPETTVLADCIEVPGIGFLPVNAFVLHAEQPVVVDTGLGLPDRDFLDVLGSVLDPADVRWIWLTHPDRDHTGGLFALLEAAPEARLVTTFLGAGIMSTERPLPMDRLYFLNPGQSLDVGDRTLHAFRPPLFDNPATVGFYDDRSRTCFSSDCFGGPMPTADLAVSTDVAQGRAWTAPGCRWWTRTASWPPWIRCGRWIPGPSCAPTSHRRWASPRSSSTPSPRSPASTRSRDRTRQPWPRCSRPSSPEAVDARGRPSARWRCATRTTSFAPEG